MSQEKTYKLIVNKAEKDWANQFISGAQILTLAESPSDWVVNLIVSGPGEDPEIPPSKQVDLDEKAEPHGIKRFQTRKPKTSPGE